MSKFSDLIPVPLAAPETRELRSARFRVVASCAVVALLLVFFGPLRASIGSFALPLLVSCATYAAIQGWLWLRAKNEADDAWLFRERDDAP